MDWVSLSNLAPLTLILTVMATAAMAASAAIQGVRQGFDPFGATVLAIVTSVGGGTLRDLLIGASPVFWLKDLTYLSTAVPVGLLTFFLANRLQKGGGRRLRLLLYLDAIGLGLFTIIGVQVALDVGLPIASAVVLGCITGVAGGMFRDVLSGLQPTILKQDLYATISVLGGLFYAIGKDYTSDFVISVLAFVLMVIFRFIVVYKSTKN